jgi:hypothetical protein
MGRQESAKEKQQRSWPISRKPLALSVCCGWIRAATLLPNSSKAPGPREREAGCHCVPAWYLQITLIPMGSGLTPEIAPSISAEYLF